ncbi:hypothetical protein CC79DRAFT_1319259 [Sarocladium strictum]
MAALTRPTLLSHLHLASLGAVRCFASRPAWQPKPHNTQPGRPVSETPWEQNDHLDHDAFTSKFAQSRPATKSSSSKSNNRKGREHTSSSKPAPPAKKATRVVIQDVNAFYSRDGRLTTTAENVQFLRETGIESDHGQLWDLTHPEASKIRKSTNIQVSFSDRYTIHPFHLRAFAPRGDPWAARMRDRYRTMLEREPLWVHSMTIFSASPAAVRFTCSRRLASCTRRAAQQLAEEDPPVMVRGTVMIVVRDPVKAVNSDSKAFQDMMVEALRKEMQDLGDAQPSSPAW